eukprot:GHVQ01002447.1.p1 GENE.GHVQ01002447.1~~GHVQ01002447.1.p1  ORF type:complete len:1074 (+),score=239.77 GHVQ01002447.1:711-3932(+)
MAPLRVSKCLLAAVAASACFVAEGKEGFRGARDNSVSCRDGYIMEETVCVKTLMEIPKAICKTGVLEGSSCVEYYSAHKECRNGFKLDGNRCSKLEQTLPKASCPVGYDLEGLLCKTSKTIEPACPQGTVELSDGSETCAAYKSASKRCREGYTPTGRYHKVDEGVSQCIKTESVMAVEGCTKGYSLKSGGGMCELVTTLTPLCPNGSKENGNGRCLIEKAAAMKCPPEYQMTTKEIKDGEVQKLCAKEVFEEVVKSCEDGYTLSADKRLCEKSVPVAPVCSQLQMETKDGSRCAVYNRAEVFCEEADYTLRRGNTAAAERDSVCEKTVRLAASVVCSSDDYELRDSNCVKTIPAPMVCPADTKETDGGGVCESKVAAMAKCSEGYTMQLKGGEKMCVKVDSIEAKAACTKDFVLSTNGVFCQKRKECEPELVCKKGAREGNRCVVYTPVPSLSCPDGFAPNNNSCTKTVQRDCSYVEYKSECRDISPCYTKDCEEKQKAAAASSTDHAFSPSVASISERRLGRIGQYIRAQTFTPSGADTAKKICEKVSVKREKMCDKLVFAEATCPVGSKMHKGSGCMKADYYDREIECPEGQFDSTTNRCVKTWMKPAVFSCPDGFSAEHQDMSTNNKHHRRPLLGLFHQDDEPQNDKKKPVSSSSPFTCVRATSVGASYHCEDKDRILEPITHLCSKTLPKVCQGGQCTRQVAVLADMQCPSGFVLSPHPEDSRVSNCLKIETTTAAYKCKTPKVLTAENMCAEYTPKQCPGGGKCEKTVWSPVKVACGEGLNLLEAVTSHSHRRKRLFASPSAGGEFSGSHAHGSSTDAAHYHGPESMCVKVVFEPIKYVCSKGEQKGDKCVKLVDKRCNGKDGLCTKTLSKNVSFSCPDSYVRVSTYDSNSNSAPLVSYGRSRTGGFALTDKKQKKRNAPVGIQCVRHRTDDFERFCKEGGAKLSDKGCSMYFKKACPDNNCVQLVQAFPKLRCDEGFELFDSDSSSSEGGSSRHYKRRAHKDEQISMCNAWVFEESLMKCHKGEQTDEKQKCKKAVPVKFVCPDGATSSGGKCVVKMYEKPMRVIA